MDRRFLSQPEVTAAAKNFVCIRLTSYEDESERAFMSTLVKGDASNTAFAILTPEGKPALHGRGSGRGPMDLFIDATDMAKGMDALAEKYHPIPAEGTPSLPVTLTPIIGLVVAASDNLPLVLVITQDNQRRGELEAKVADPAWSKEFAGRFTYAVSASTKDFPKIKGHTIKEGVLLIEPDIFGLKGSVMEEVSVDRLSEDLTGAMRRALDKHAPIAKTRIEMSRKGFEEGVFYETGIPVSGRGEAADRERYRQQLLLKKEN